MRIIIMFSCLDMEATGLKFNALYILPIGSVVIKVDKQTWKIFLL